MRASDAGCWFVQNARSNRKNRVGYPLGLAGAARVALGTDGFPSNMPDEAAALAETSAAAGEPPDAIGGRLDAGWTLVAERLGISRERLAADAGARPFGQRHRGDRSGRAGAGVTPLGEMVEKVRRHS